MIDLRPWLDVAEPRRDIADGSFDESLFAADLGLVDRGRGPADYLDPVTFCEKTYLTENLLAFLGELAARLSGDVATAAVYRLQTEFGGGKTHTLLAAYHLFRDPARVAGTAFVSELAGSLGRTSFPKATVVVLEGGRSPRASPTRPSKTPRSARCSASSPIGSAAHPASPRSPSKTGSCGGPRPRRSLICWKRTLPV